MLNADLTVTSNLGSVTLPGSAGATTYAQIQGNVGNGAIVRRVASTANTTPQLLTVSHQESGTGFKQRIRSLVRYDYKANNTDIADTGGVVPSFSVYLVIDRPAQSGGAITDTKVKDGIGSVMHVLVAAGQLDKILNQEA
jgi:hypothetical protein